MLRPDRLRQVPKQFSWVDQGLVQRRLIDRCDARAAALYLFLVTVSDAQGMSYYGAAALTQRLHLDSAELDLARRQLIELELIAYQAPLTQVLALPGAPGKASPTLATGQATTQASTVSAATTPPRASAVAPERDRHADMRSLAQIFEQMGHRRA